MKSALKEAVYFSIFLACWVFPVWFFIGFIEYTLDFSAWTEGHRRTAALLWFAPVFIRMIVEATCRKPQ